MSVPMLRYDTATGGFKDLGLAWAQFMGLPRAHTPTLKEFGKAPADEAWVSSCIRRRYTAAMSVPLVVYVKDGERRVTAEQSSNQAAKDLQHLLDDVNPVDMQAGDLKAFLEAGLCAWGEGYIKKVRGRLGGPPQELYWLPASDVTPVPDAGPAPVTGYAYQPIGAVKATTYPVKDVVAYRYVNLANPRRGLSPLAAVRAEMRVNIGAAENTASTLENWGVPPGAWVVPKGADIAPQDQRLIKRAIAALRGPRNAGKTPVLPEGIEWKPIALNPKDAEWLAARKVSRMTICAALGVPLVLAGDDDKASVYASIRDAERVFWRNTMIPELDWIADGFNSWLVPDFTTKRDIVVAFDYTGIEALRAAPAEELAQWLIATDKGLPINRVIARFGMGEPIKGGDEPKDSTGQSKADIAGVLIRAGFEPKDVLQYVGLPPMDHTWLEPITVSEQGDYISGGKPAPKPPSRPRPAEYSTARAAAASLGKGLYRHDAVKAYLASGDPAVLEALVPEDEVERLALGLQKRLPAAKLIAEWDVPAPASPPTPETPVVVKVYNDAPDQEHAATLAALQADAEARFALLRDELAASTKAQSEALAEVSRTLTEALKAATERPAREVQTVVRDERGRIVSVVKEAA